MADADGNDDLGESMRVVMVRTTLGGGGGGGGAPVYFWKPEIRGCGGDGRRGAAAGVGTEHNAGASAVESPMSARRQPAPPTTRLPPCGSGGGQSACHTARRHLAREQQHNQQQRRRRGDGSGACPGAASVPSLRLPTLEVKLDGAALGRAHTARANAINPRVPTQHAADSALPPAALTCREALAVFERTHDLRDTETPPDLPLASGTALGPVAPASALGLARSRSQRGADRLRGGRSGEVGAAQQGAPGAARGGQRPERGAAAAKAGKRRSRVLLAGVEQNPVFGLLCGITPPQLAAAFDEVRRENKGTSAAVATAEVGLEPATFARLLRRLVPHVDVSDAYAEQMFDRFDGVVVNNHTKRLLFSDLLGQFSQHVAPAETQRSIRFFFSLFEDPDARGFMPIRALDGAAVRQFTTDAVVGDATIKWQRLGTALSLEKHVRQLVARADQVLGFTRSRPAGGQLEALRKKSALQRATATAASRQALQHALAGTMITLEDLRHLVMSNPRLYAAFSDLSFPRLGAPGQREFGGATSSRDALSRPSSVESRGGGGGGAADAAKAKTTTATGKAPTALGRAAVKPRRKKKTTIAEAAPPQVGVADGSLGASGGVSGA